MMKTIRTGVLLAVVATVVSARGARADDCTEVDQDTVAWAAKVVVKGASVVDHCDDCAKHGPATPQRVKRVDVRRAPHDGSKRALFVEGQAVDLGVLYVQTGKDTWTNVAVMVGCTTAAPQVLHADAWQPPPVSGGAATGLASCDEYLRVFDRYLTCDKVPQEAKDASREGIDQMKQAWAMLRDPSVPPDARKAAADACKQAVDALQQAAKAIGCKL